jgi:hypothetical protein
MTVPGGQHRTGRSEYDLPNGSVIVPLGVNDGQRMYSAEWTFAYIAEAIELEEKKVVELAGCMRYIRSPERPNLPDYSQIVVDANPGPPLHWLNLKAEDADDTLRMVETRADYMRLQAYNWRPSKDPKNRWKRLITKHQDNPGYWDYANWRYTPLGEKYVTESLGSLTGHLRKRWLYGLWTVASGAVFPEFEPEIHTIEDFEPPPSWPMVLAYDPGFGTTAMLWVALAPDGGIFVVDEIYEGGKRRNLKHGRNVLRMFADPNEAFSARAQGPSCAQQAMKYGLRFVPWPADKGPAFDAGVEAVRHVLANTVRANPTGHYLKVCKRCKGLQANLSSWSYKRDKSGEMVAGADQYEKGNDHAIDCLRGVIQSQYLQTLHRRGLSE